jgi:hypothetical protein
MNFPIILILVTDDKRSYQSVSYIALLLRALMVSSSANALMILASIQSCTAPPRVSYLRRAHRRLTRMGSCPIVLDFEYPLGAKFVGRTTCESWKGCLAKVVIQ